MFPLTLETGEFFKSNLFNVNFMSTKNINKIILKYIKLFLCAHTCPYIYMENYYRIMNHEYTG